MLILVAEDDAQTARDLRDGLGEIGHDVVVVSTGAAAIHAAALRRFDGVILDRMMAEGDGMEVLQALRARGDRVPVLMLTACDGIGDRVAGLDAGADDYLVKPFAFEELIARLNALERRWSTATHDAEMPVTALQWGRLTIDLLRRRATFDGRRLLIQPRELDLLEALMHGEGSIVTKSMLLEKVWNLSFTPRTNIVETHVCRLRTKLAEVGGHDLIGTVRGVGYRMCDAR